jgi:hypothetical protein
MPAVVVGRPKRSEAMWEALKTHIVRERQKKKQGTPYIVFYTIFVQYFV